MQHIKEKERCHLRLDIFEASETSGLRQSPGCSLVKNPPAMREPQVQSLGQEDALEEEMATHSSILAWRIPQTEEPGGLQSTGLQRVGRNFATTQEQHKKMQFQCLLGWGH